MVESNYAVAPGEYIEEWLEEHNVTRAVLAWRLGVSESYADELIGGKIPMTPEVMIALEGLTSIPIGSWQRLEIRYWQDVKRLGRGGDQKEAAAELRRRRDALHDQGSLVNDIADER